jgi:hypothetical protein
MIVPSTLRFFRVPALVLRDTRELLREAGLDGFEAVAVWIGRPRDHERADVLAAAAPRQVAYRSARGSSVEVSQDALLHLLGAMPEDTAVLARVHTRSAEGSSSGLDRTDMLIAHQGAISIVVPNLAREPITLDRCSINVLDHQTGWRELSSHDVRERFDVR